MSPSLKPPSSVSPVEEWRAKYVKAMEQHSRDVEQLEYIRGVLEAERLKIAVLQRERLELSGAVLLLVLIILVLVSVVL